MTWRVARARGASPATIARRSDGIVPQCYALGGVILVLGAVGLEVAIGPEVSVDFSRREQKDLVGRRRWCAGAAADVVIGHLRDGLDLGLELRGQKRPEVSDIETVA